jgi:protein-tyrosine-phosphatase
MSSSKPKVLFLCTGNSARSQMAEGYLRYVAGDEFEPLSAGIEPKSLNPLAVEAMSEIGIDISRQTSKDVVSFLGQSIPYIVTAATTPENGARSSHEHTSSCTGALTIPLLCRVHTKRSSQFSVVCATRSLGGSTKNWFPALRNRGHENNRRTAFFQPSDAITTHDLYALLQQVGEQQESLVADLTARTNALMNLPST